MPIWRVAATYTGWAGGPGVNVWHLRTDANGDLDIVDLRAQIDGAMTALSTFYTNVAAKLAGNLTISFGGELVNVETNEIAPHSSAKTVATSTTGVSNAPTPLALVVGWHTTLRARRGMGRTFLGPLALSFADQPVPPEADIAPIRSAAQALVDTSTTANGWAFGVYGLQQPLKTSEFDAQGRPLKVLRDFTGVKITPQWAVLRSRRD